MYASLASIQRKTKPGYLGRFEFIQALVTEFQEATNAESKLQILANLANFAYDPFNYDFLIELCVPDLFFDCIEEKEEKLVEFGIAGLCNCCNGEFFFLFCLCLLLKKRRKCSRKDPFVAS